MLETPNKEFTYNSSVLQIIYTNLSGQWAIVLPYYSKDVNDYLEKFNEFW